MINSLHGCRLQAPPREASVSVSVSVDVQYSTLLDIKYGTFGTKISLHISIFNIIVAWDRVKLDYGRGTLLQ